MAKGLRSKVKKRNRSYMRKTVGETVRSAQIEATTQRLAAKRAGMANTRTIVGMKHALGIDLGKAYYDAVVRPQQVPDAAAVGDDDDVEDDMEDVTDAAVAPAEPEEPAREPEDPAVKKAKEAEYDAVYSVASTAKRSVAQTEGKRLPPRKKKLAGSAVFSKRNNARSTRPPKEMVKF